MIRTILAAALALAMLTMPAAAQFYGGSDDGYRRAPRGYDYDDNAPRPRRRYDPDFDQDRGGDRRGRGDRYTQPQPQLQQPLPGRGQPGRGGGAFSPTCVTARGSCQSTPQAVGTGCVCFVPGTGNVPGTVR